MRSKILSKIMKIVDSNSGDISMSKVSAKELVAEEVSNLSSEPQNRLEAVVQKFRNEEYYKGSSPISKLFLCLELESMGLKQVDMAELLNMSPAYISIIMKFRHLPEELLVMCHAGSKGASRKIPIDGVNNMNIPKDEEGNILTVSYKTLDLLAKILPRVSDSQFYKVRQKLCDIVLQESMLRAMSEMKEKEFNKFFKAAWSSDKPISPSNIVNQVKIEKAKMDEDPIESLMKLIDNDSPKIRVFVEELIGSLKTSS